MAHRLDLAVPRRRLSAAARMAVIASLHLAIYAESSHTHGDGPDLAGRCSLCQFVHDPGPAIVSGTRDILGPSSQRTPAPQRHWSTPRTTHFTPNRSRAPPVLVSLAEPPGQSVCRPTPIDGCIPDGRTQHER